MSGRPGPALRVVGVLAVAAVVVLAVAGITTALLTHADQPGASGQGPASPVVPSFAAGMLHLEYQVLPVGGGEPGPGDVETVASVPRARIDPMGIAESAVTVADGGRILVDLAVPADDPSVTDPICALLGTTGRLDFVPLGDEPASPGQALDLAVHRPLFSGDQVASAKLGLDQAGRQTVDITLGPEGARVFADYTAASIGTYFAIVVDGVVISAPVIQDTIPDGEVQISGGGVGGYPLTEAQRLIAILQSSALPFPIEEVTNNLP